MQLPKGSLFVTGTDTGIGKTVVSAILTLGLGGRYWKPIQSGTEGETDTAAVRRWTGLPAPFFLPERYLLRAPLSPHASARLDGVEIRMEELTRPLAPPLDGRGTPLGEERPLVIEGAGGLLVPLNAHELVADLIRALGVEAIVVSRTTLGTINHTLLTLAELRRREIPIRGVILNGEENIGNLEAIRSYGEVPVIGRVPPLPHLDPPALQAAFAGLDQEVLAPGARPTIPRAAPPNPESHPTAPRDPHP